MAQSGDAFRKQHDVNEPKNDPGMTPSDLDDEFIEGGEVAGDLDKLHEGAYGDEKNQPLDKEVDEDEIARVKGLSEEEQEKG